MKVCFCWNTRLIAQIVFKKCMNLFVKLMLSKYQMGKRTQTGYPGPSSALRHDLSSCIRRSVHQLTTTFDLVTRLNFISKCFSGNHHFIIVPMYGSDSSRWLSVICVHTFRGPVNVYRHDTWRKGRVWWVNIYHYNVTMSWSEFFSWTTPFFKGDKNQNTIKHYIDQGWSICRSWATSRSQR